MRRRLAAEIHILELTQGDIRLTMASTTVFDGLLANRVVDFITSQLSTSAVVMGGMIFGIFLLNFLMTPHLSPDEPPLVKPSIPWIGHIINVLRKQNSFHYDEQ